MKRIPWRWLFVLLIIGALLPLRGRPRTVAPPHRATLLPAGEVRVRALQAGAGDTTILLLHGYGESLMTWRGVVDPLAQRARVLAIDLPGFGASDKPADGPYTLDAQVGRLTALLDSSVSGPVVVMGHSMGGELAALLALARPEQVVALVLIAPAGIEIGLAGLVDTMGDTKARLISWYQAIRGLVLPIHDPDWLAEPPDLAAYDLTLDPAYRHSSTRMLAEFDFRGLRRRLHQVRQPTLLIWGRHDPVVPYAAGVAMERQMPCATLLTLEETLHRPHVERPQVVLEAVHRFLTAPSCGAEPSGVLDSIAKGAGPEAR